MSPHTRVTRNCALPYSYHLADKARLDRLGLEELDSDGGGEVEDDMDIWTRHRRFGEI